MGTDVLDSANLNSFVYAIPFICQFGFRSIGLEVNLYLVCCFPNCNEKVKVIRTLPIENVIFNEYITQSINFILYQ